MLSELLSDELVMGGGGVMQCRGGGGLRLRSYKADSLPKAGWLVAIEYRSLLARAPS
jgi:hypothetical protein